MPGFPSVGFFAENYQKRENAAPIRTAFDEKKQVRNRMSLRSAAERRMSLRTSRTRWRGNSRNISRTVPKRTGAGAPPGSLV